MDKNYYSGLSKSNLNPTLGEYYNDSPKHFYIVLMTIVALCLPPSLDDLLKSWNENKLLLSSSIIILILALYRAFQALALARIDYEYLSAKKYDNIIFSAVTLLLVTGGLVTLLYINIAYYFFTYSFISLLATINFISLYKRIYEERSRFDYLSEIRIQLFNASAFLLLTILFCVIGIIKYLSIPNMDYVYIALSFPVCLLLILNIYHSHALTYYPKIILSNELDVTNTNIGQIIKIQRAEPNDMKRIAVELTNEFGYVFERIFAEDRVKVLRKYVYTLLTSSFGFGDWGYMRFYNIVNKDGIKVGWMRIDTMYSCWIYTILERIILLIRFSHYLGIVNLYKVAYRAQNILKEQPKVDKDTFVLSYIVIRKPYRQMEYGYYAVELLKNAFFNSQTNNINVKRLSLLVRPYNTASIALFRKSKFKENVMQDKILFQYDNIQ